MTDDLGSNELPVRGKLLREASEDDLSLDRLRDFAKADLSAIGNGVDLARATSGVGEDLSGVIRGINGRIEITRSGFPKYGNFDEMYEWQDWRNVLEGDRFKATLVSNERHVSDHVSIRLSYDGKPERTMKNGFEIRVPINVDEHDIIVDDFLPGVEVWKDGESRQYMLGQDENNPEVQRVYAERLQEAVKAVIEVASKG